MEAGDGVLMEAGDVELMEAEGEEFTSVADTWPRANWLFGRYSI